jgi:eukaryotic-like serine/threonine-protein kinase
MDSPSFLYRFGTAEFDESRYELRVAGLRVDVEHRALEVLACLLRRAGEVVTKEELFREVWSGRVTVDKVLPNAVTKLRRALGETNASHVTTQARIGYRFDGSVTRMAVGRQPVSALQLEVGQSVPGRPNFELAEQLGRRPGSEVWRTRHRKTQEPRVYKFAVDGDRLRALKREATLLRVLHESLDDTQHLIELLDWNFSMPPYFLECRDGGVSLSMWAATHLQSLNTSQRLELFLQIVDAVAAAHSVGVLHKDIKPANVLVAGDATRPHVRLTDFGSGHMLEPNNLAQLGITRLGMTIEDVGLQSGEQGTSLYIAPEHFAGVAPTVRSDVFALGVLLYQIVSGRLDQPLVPGWESGIDDEFLREDIRLATDGAPERRLASAAALSERLRDIDSRRAIAKQRSADAEAARLVLQRLERTEARKPYIYALIALLSLSALTAFVLRQQAVSSRDLARAELGRASALARFLNEDLIGRANPLVWAKGQDATLRDVLLVARDRVPQRFASQPQEAAAIHGSLASLFDAIDLFPEAESEARLALKLGQSTGSGSNRQLFDARAVLARVLARQGNFADAEHELSALVQLAETSPFEGAQQQIAIVRSTLLTGKNDFGAALEQLRSAIDAFDSQDPSLLAQRDTLRVDLVRTLAMAGKDDEANLQGQLLIKEARARKEDHLLLVALTQVALVRAQGEDHAAAEKLLTEAEPVIVSRLGENHSRHLSLLTERMRVEFQRADWPKAAGFAGMIAERTHTKFGSDHVRTWVTLLNWARTLDESGRAAEAAGKARQAHTQLVRLVGPRSPQSQDAAFVLALIELELGRTAAGQALIEQLDAEVLESGRAIGQWPMVINALRGIALQQRREHQQAKPLLDTALAGMKEEESLAQPSRLYLVAKQSRALIR